MYMYTLMRRMFFKQVFKMSWVVLMVRLLEYKPHQKNNENESDFVNWKGFLSLNVQVFLFFLFCYYNTPINIFLKRVTSGTGQGHIAILTNWLAKSKSTKQKQDFYDSTRIYIFINFSNLNNYVRSAFS